MNTTLEKPKQYLIMDVRSAEEYREPIVFALTEINHRSGNHHPAEVVFDHLKRRVLERRQTTWLLLFFEAELCQVNGPRPEDVCGLMTVDQFEDEIGEPVCCITRAWTRPGMVRALWNAAKPEVFRLAKNMGAKTLTGMSERDGWARVLQPDGFEQKETMYVARL